MKKVLLSIILVLTFTVGFCLTVSASAQDTAEPVYHATSADASEELLVGMLDRKEEITIGYRTNNSDCNIINIIHDIYDAAFEHSDIPNAGDYLKYNRGNWQYSLSQYSTDTVTYFTIIYKPKYYTTAEQEAELYAEIDRVLAQLNLEDKDEYERATAIYEYICQNVTYDHDHLDDESYKRQYTAYAALIDGTAVCQGYATLFYRMALEADLDARVISGLGNGERHAWNIVKIGDYYYNLDATWDADPASYQYYLKCNANFPSHQRNEETLTPEFMTAYPMSSEDYVYPYLKGICGENLTWKLDNDGILTISGTGAMYDYGNYTGTGSFSYSQKPWDSSINVKKVIIEDGVTSIGSATFVNQTRLSEVTVGSSLKNVGDFSFFGCTSLNQVHFAGTPPTIRSYAFYYNNAFTGYTTPLEFTISFTEGTGGWTTPTWTAPDGTLYNTVIRNASEHPLPIIIASGNCGNQVTWSLDETGSLTISGSGNMSDIYILSASPWYNYISNIRSVLINNGVTNIGKMAFANCANLTEVFVSNSVTNIEYNAFINCSNLTTITLPDSVTSIGDQAFRDCVKLTNISIPDSVTYIGYGAFCGCSNLPAITIPSNITCIDVQAFCGCSSLTEIIIPQNVTCINNCAFKNCSNLTKITMPDSMTRIGDEAFYGCSVLSEITIPNNVTSINAKTFYGCDNLTKITISGKITTIGNSAFWNCSKLSDIFIPNSVTNIGQSAFWNCSSLSSITIPDSVTRIGQSAFGNCSSLSSITIPDSVTCIEPSTFWHCFNLTEVTIPNDVISIGDKAFYWCANLSEVIIPNGVKSIGDKAFYWCANLSEVIIPNSVTTIGIEAFSKCSKLSKAIFMGDVPDNIQKNIFASTASDFSLHYYDTCSGWTTPTWTAPDGTVYCTTMLKRSPVVEIVDPQGEVTYTAQEQTLTVSHAGNAACIVMYKDTDGQYKTIEATQNNDGSYSFDTLIGTDDITIAVKGDYDGSGNVTVDDAKDLQKAILGKEDHVGTPDPVSDINGDGRITAIDLALIAAAALNKYQLTW